MKTSAAGACYIKMENVDLYYPASIYNAMTIKEELFSLLGGRKNKKALPDVHALRSISLEINEGERVGIIGANGAGKSSILKAIAGLFPIRGGRLETAGEVRALFELSLGFEADSTGRENIMNRGLMLGRTPAEVREIAPEIIEFADLKAFIDYPIRSYSSGMLVRLAFAISTSISGQILLVDEILSAGDASFQIKARQRMKSVIAGAKILVLVLHDMAAIKEVCGRAIWLRNGSVAADGPPEQVIDEYLKAPPS
jgi:lipopolysaccharide transport system ATP-binding protein